MHRKLSNRITDALVVDRLDYTSCSQRLQDGAGDRLAPPVQSRDHPGAGIDSEAVDLLIDLYCDWRTECAAVHAAYEDFSNASAAERPGAFEVYLAALRHEGLAAQEYAAQIQEISHRVTTPAATPDPNR